MKRMCEYIYKGGNIVDDSQTMDDKEKLGQM